MQFSLEAIQWLHRLGGQFLSFLPFVMNLVHSMCNMDILVKILHHDNLLILLKNSFQLKWEAPNEEELVKFLVEEKGFRLAGY